MVIDAQNVKLTKVPQADVHPSSLLLLSSPPSSLLLSSPPSLLFSCLQSKKDQYTLLESTNSSPGSEFYTH